MPDSNSEFLNVAKQARTNTRILLAVVWLNILFAPLASTYNKAEKKELRDKLESLDKQNQELKAVIDSLIIRLPQNSK